MKEKLTDNKVLIIIVLSLFFAFLLIIYLLFFRLSNEKREEIIINAGKIYYEKYMSNVSGVNQVEITLEMLNNSSDNEGKPFNLMHLGKCKKDTKVTLNIENKKIKNYKVTLNCN